MVILIHLPNYVLFACSYRENPSLGDPNSLVEELLHIRNKVRIKEADLSMIKGKVCRWCHSNGT